MASDPYSGAPNPGAPQNSGGNKKVIVIIVAVIVAVMAVPCLGILAAISIPAFLRYIKSSKAAEAEMVISQMATKVSMHVAEKCEFPPALPPHADIEMCAGGAKCLPAGPIDGFWSDLDLDQPKYFVYSATMVGDQMVLRAQADFDRNSPELHTAESYVSIADCSAEAGPVMTIDEFE
jgi:Tfp pilus assembly major pilin PilA